MTAVARPTLRRRLLATDEFVSVTEIVPSRQPANECRRCVWMPVRGPCTCRSGRQLAETRPAARGIGYTRPTPPRLPSPAA